LIKFVPFIINKKLEKDSKLLLNTDKQNLVKNGKYTNWKS